MNLQNVFINYLDYGKKDGQPIVLLHGWGQNIEMIKPIGDHFIKDYRIVIIDLPGYGKSDEPLFPWTVNDYVKAIKQLLANLKIDNPIIIGHSFGGKIGLLYASMYNVLKLVVLGSPYKQNIKSPTLKLKLLKTLKKVPGLKKLEEFAKKRIGSEDYRNATPLMRQVLVNTVNLDITNELLKIKSPTLIIWGDNDEAVPVADAYELEKIISNAGLVVIEGGTHYVYLEKLNYVLTIIESLVKEN